MKSVLLFTLVIFSPVGVSAEADLHTGTISQKIGRVSILSNPSETVQGPPPHALFEGRYYSERVAKRGTKIYMGEVVQTSKIGRAKIIFANGDHFTIGPQSAFKIEVNSEGGIKKPRVDIYSGKVRALIDSAGPRNSSEVRTRSMVMGVRGTDFFVDAYTKAGKSEVTVIRGKVEVAPRNSKDVQPTEVTTGYTAAVGLPRQSSPKVPPSVQQKAAGVVVGPSKPAHLATIARTSKIEKPDAPDRIDPQVKSEVEALEKKAAANTLKDIKKYDPKLYEYIESSQSLSKDFEALDTLVNERLEKKAKASKQEPALKKPNLKEDDKDDVYDKYYKK